MLQGIKRIARPVLANPILGASSSIAIGNILSKGLGFLQSVVLIRTLGVHDYGLLVFITALVSFIVQFMDVQSDEGIVKFMGSAYLKKDYKASITYFTIGFGIDLGISILAFCVISLLVPVLTNLSPDKNLLNLMIGIYVFAVPITLMQGTFNSLLVTFKAFPVYSAILVTSDVLMLVCSLMLAPYGVAAVTFGYLMATIASFMALVIISLIVTQRRLGTFRGNNYRAALREFLPFIFHTNLTGYLKAIFGYIDVFVLGIVAPPSALALYQIATSSTGMVMLAITPIRSVIFPWINEAWASQQMDRVRSLVRRFNTYTGAVSGLGVIFFFVAGSWLVNQFYGSEAAGAVPAIYVMSIVNLIGNLLIWIRPVALAAGKPSLMTYATIVPSLVRVLLTIFLGSQYGLMGVIASQLITVVLNFIFNWVIIVPRIGLYDKRQPVPATVEVSPARVEAE